MTKPEINCINPALIKLGFIHIAFNMGSEDAVNDKTEELRAMGYVVASEPRITGDGYYESCVLGPEGIQIEITV